MLCNYDVADWQTLSGSDKLIMLSLTPKVTLIVELNTAVATAIRNNCTAAVMTGVCSYGLVDDAPSHGSDIE
jgi:hypothetical protein